MKYHCDRCAKEWQFLVEDECLCGGNVVLKPDLVVGGPHVVIMRGLSGSGKSRLAEELAGPMGLVVTTDNYFMVDGEYRFDLKKLARAHSDCRKRFIDGLRASISVVVVDNTNGMLWEYEDYLKIAGLVGYRYLVVEMDCPDRELMRVCSERNTKGTPFEVTALKWARWEEDGRAVKWPIGGWR